MVVNRGFSLQSGQSAADLAYNGEVSVQVKYVSVEHVTSSVGGELQVLVKSARNLRALRSNGTSDSFCKV